MYVLDKLAFIAHPRTGSRSCRHVLMELGAAEIGSHHDVSEGAVKTILHQEGVIACTVRNIFDTLVSWWHNNNFQDGTGTPLKHEGPQPFSEFVYDRITNKVNHRWFQKKLYHYALKWPDCRIVRYENLEEDFAKLLKDVGYQATPMPHIGQSLREPYQKYYTPGLRAAVERRWKKDFDRTGYEF
jgi:hypothetical protein